MKGTVRNIAADAGDPHAPLRRDEAAGRHHLAHRRLRGRRPDLEALRPRSGRLPLLAHPTRPGVVVALARTTLYVSRNGGRSFTPRLLGFFPKLYRNDGFVGAFAGDALVVSGSWGPERKLGVAATIQKDGGLHRQRRSRPVVDLVSDQPDVGRHRIGARRRRAGARQPARARARPGLRQPPAADRDARLARPGAAGRRPRAVAQGRHRATPAGARCAACRARSPARPRRPRRIGTDRNPGILGLPPFQLRRQASLDYAVRLPHDRPHARRASR